MNFFPFHIGDYAAHTAHLEPMEDLAYRRMIDAYYLRESPLPADIAEVARLVRMRQHVTEVEAVLREFFALDESGWRHQRCDEEIDRMLDKQAKARASAAASVNARRAKVAPEQSECLTSAEPTVNERSTSAELPTPTPTPTPEKNKARTAPAVRPDFVPEQVWADFLAIRRANRAPLTETALAGIEREAVQAGLSLADALAVCCERGWRGFKAEWWSPHKGNERAGPPSKRESVIAELTGRNKPAEEYIDVVTAEVRRIG